MADGGGNDHIKLWLRTEVGCVQEHRQLHPLDGPRRDRSHEHRVRRTDGAKLEDPDRMDGGSS